MPFREALFWIGIAMAGPGAYFWIEHPESFWGPVLTVIGSAAIVCSILRGRENNSPIVEILRYGVGPNGHGQGVYVAGRHAPSYEVQVKPITLTQEWTLHFDDVISRLEGDGFLTGIASRGSHDNLSLDAVWRSLRETGSIPEIFAMDLRYRDAGGRWYSSSYELHRDVTKPHPGFDVKFFGRRKVRKLFNREKF
jgi:hypothetical protein